MPPHFRRHIQMDIVADAEVLEYMHVNGFAFMQRLTQPTQAGRDGNECSVFTMQSTPRSYTHTSTHADKQSPCCLPAIDIPHSCGLHALTSHHRLLSASLYNTTLPLHFPLFLSQETIQYEYTLYFI